MAIVNEDAIARAVGVKSAPIDNGQVKQTLNNGSAAGAQWVKPTPSSTATQPVQTMQSNPNIVNTPIVNAPTYNESQHVTQGGTDSYGGQSNPYNEILYSKKQWEAGQAAGNAGLQNWAAKNAQNFYGMLDPAEAKAVQAMSTQELIDYMSTRKQGTQQYFGSGSTVLDDARIAADAGLEGTMAEIEQAKADQIAALEKAYNDAVEAGEMSIREAQAAYEAEVKNINQNAYNDAQNTNVVASARGIGNSQQMLGMQASDASRANGLRNEAGNALNTTMANLKSRLNTLKANKDLDIANVNKTFDLEGIRAKSAADAQFAENAFNFNSENFQANRDQGFQKELIAEQTKAQEQLMIKQSGLNINEMKVKLGIDKELGAFMNDLELMNMAKAHGYDLEILGKTQAFQAAMQRAQLAAQASEGAKNRAAANKSDSDNYALALERELAKYTPGTKEYQIVQAQLKAANDAASSEALNGLKTDVAIEQILSNPSFDITQYDSLDELISALGGTVTTTGSSQTPQINLPNAKKVLSEKEFWTKYFPQALNPFN